METTFRNAKSIHGIDVDVLKSGIQKYVRRNMPDEALWCAVELDLFVNADDKKAGESIRTNAIHRLMIIYLEEISICNFGLWGKLDEKVKVLLSNRVERKNNPGKWEKMRKQEMEALVWIVTHLSNSRHIRILSHLNSSFGHGKSKETLDVTREFYPDIHEIILRFDKDDEPEMELSGLNEPTETIRFSKNFLASLEKGEYSAFHWARQLCQLDKTKQRYYRCTKPQYLVFYLLEEFFKTREEKDFLMEIHQSALGWFRELSGTRESFLCFWALIACVVVGWQTRNLEIMEIPCYKEVYEKNSVDKEALELADYVLDKHTKVGRINGKNTIDFVFNGAFVAKEAKIGDSRLRHLYEDINLYREGGMKKVRLSKAPKESEFFSPIVKAQLVCGTGKTDTYFALNRENRRVFVKGPFKEREHSRTVLKIAKIKELLGLSTLLPKRHYLLPDLFPDCVMGVRTKAERNQKMAFLEFEDKTTEDKLPKTKKSGKVTPETKVVDWSKVESIQHFCVLECKDEELLFEFCLCVIFRVLLGIPDLADRNFLYVVKEHRIYSIDEDICGRDVSLESSLKKNRYNAYREILSEQKQKIEKVLDRWKEIFQKELDYPKGIDRNFVMEKFKNIYE